MIQFPDIAPEIFTISAFGLEFSLRWYAMAYIIGILLGWRLAVLATRRADLWPKNQSPIDPLQVEDLLTYVILGVILGGRLGYVLFYQPAYYLSHPLEIFMIWQGGMAFHGGLLGVVVAALYFFRKCLVPLGSGADLLALSVPIGLLLGRLANFINAELWGRPTDMPWGVIFPGEAAQTCGQISGPCARHPSQLYEAFLEGLVLGLILIVLTFGYKALKRPWFITGVFFAGYGIARTLVEFVRQADPQFITPGNPVGYLVQFGDYGVTMGQILSSPMWIIGFALILWSRPKAQK